jgi:hypothetical protein
MSMAGRAHTLDLQRLNAGIVRSSAQALAFKKRSIIASESWPPGEFGK